MKRESVRFFRATVRNVRSSLRSTTPLEPEGSARDDTPLPRKPTAQENEREPKKEPRGRSEEGVSAVLLSRFAQRAVQFEKRRATCRVEAKHTERNTNQTADPKTPRARNSEPRLDPAERKKEREARNKGSPETPRKARWFARNHISRVLSDIFRNGPMHHTSQGKGGRAQRSQGRAECSP